MKQIDIFACVKEEKKVEKDDIEKEFDRFHESFSPNEELLEEGTKALEKHYNADMELLKKNKKNILETSPMELRNYRKN